MVEGEIVAMANLGLIFLTGLTTGGLSCLAVQGGLLATSVAKQTEDDLLEATKRKYSTIDVAAEHARETEAVKPRTAKPILLFLSSKIVAYTILGALLGLLGSMLQLTPYMRAAFQLAIGIYMLGLAMHLLGVHPIFRYFMIQPPRFITRYIRRKAKTGADDVVTPTFLGALTVFIPCGITMAMMVIAAGTGNALAGAAVMFAFTLGTTPVFFTLAYTAAKLGSKKQALFLKFAAVAVIIFGLLAIEGGLNLAGSPVSYARVKRNFSVQQEPTVSTPTPTSTPTPAPQPAPAAAPAPRPAPSVGVLSMTAGRSDYLPAVMRASAGKPYKLEIKSDNSQGCGRAMTIPSLGIQKVLPVNGTTVIDLPPQKKGSLEITCSMGMYYSEIRFD